MHKAFDELHHYTPVKIILLFEMGITHGRIALVVANVAVKSRLFTSTNRTHAPKGSLFLIFWGKRKLNVLTCPEAPLSLLQVNQT